LPSIDSPLAGRRSISWKPKQTARPADPPYIASAATAELYDLRTMLAAGVGSAAGVGVERACELIEQATPILAKLPAADRRTLALAGALRDTGNVLLGLSSAATTTARRCVQAADRVAQEMASELVKRPGELRNTVSYLLLHHLPEDH